MNDNKLISEFMGVVFHDDENQYYNADGLHIGNTLQYHTSWDWLMPVVQECFDTQQPSEGQHYFINESLLTMDIDVVYDRAVEFIQEYRLTPKEVV